MAEKAVRVTGKLTPPISLSPTSASSWRQCELRYALAYLFGWREPSTLSQLIGNVTHRTVELLYGRQPRGRTRALGSQLLREALAEEVVAKPTYAKLLDGSDPSAEVLEKGEDALDGLFELEDPRYITVGPEGLEVWVEAELYNAPVRGRIDRLYDASGAQVVADYKTGRTPGFRFVEKAFFGLWTYAAALAAADAEHRLADRIELLYLIGRDRLARPVLREVALEQAKVLARIWREIQAALERPTLTARTSKLCEYCGFASLCPAKVRYPLPAVGSADYERELEGLGLTRRSRSEVARGLERLEAPAPQAEAEQ